MNTIILLPSEILWKIFSYCDIHTILQTIPFVCHKWCSISRQLPMAGYVDLKIFDEEQFQKFEFPLTYKLAPQLKYIALNNSGKYIGKGKSLDSFSNCHKYCFSTNARNSNNICSMNGNNTKGNVDDTERYNGNSSNNTGKYGDGCEGNNKDIYKDDCYKNSSNELKKDITRARSLPIGSMKKGITVSSSSINKKYNSNHNGSSNNNGGGSNGNSYGYKDYCSSSSSSGYCSSNNYEENINDVNKVGQPLLIKKNNANYNNTNNESYIYNNRSQADGVDNYKEINKKKKKRSCSTFTNSTNSSGSCSSKDTKMNSKIQKNQPSVIGISTLITSSSISPASIVHSISSRNKYKSNKSCSDNGCKYKGKVLDNINDLDNCCCCKSNFNNNEESTSTSISTKDKNVKISTYCFEKFKYDQRTELPIGFNICIVIPLSYIIDENSNIWYNPVESFLSNWKISVKQLGFNFIVNSIEISINSNINNSNSNVLANSNPINKLSHTISRIALPSSIISTYPTNDMKSTLLSSSTSTSGKTLNMKSKSRNSNFKSPFSRSQPPTTTATASINLNSSIPFTPLITSSPLSKTLSLASTATTSTSTTTIIPKNNVIITKNNIIITMELLNLLLDKKKFLPRILKVDNVEWTMDMLNLIPNSVNYLELSFVGIPNVELVKTGVSYLSSFIKNISILSCTIIRPRSRLRPRYYHLPPYFNKKSDICI